MEIEKRLHLECGFYATEGWVNLDGSWHVWLSKYPKLHWVSKGFKDVVSGQDIMVLNGTRNIISTYVRKRLPFPDDYLHADVTSAH